MNVIIQTLIENSLTASVIILIVLILRRLIRQMPKLYSYLLWPAVFLKLIIPVTLTAPLSLMPAAVSELSFQITEALTQEALPQASKTPADTTANQTETLIAAASSDRSPLRSAAMIWISGMMTLLGISLIQMRTFRRRCRDAVPISPGVAVCSRINSPVLLGFIHPQIVLPEGLTEEECVSILRHERVHLQRKDHWIKLSAYLIACIHWFNPLVWLAFALMSRDMEMSCDEAVIRDQNTQMRRQYSLTLLRLASAPSPITGRPPAFADTALKQRIQNVLNYKKLPVRIGIVLTAGLGAILILTLVNPRTAHLDDAPTLAGQFCKALTDQDAAAMRSLLQIQSDADIRELMRFSSPICEVREDSLSTYQNQVRIEADIEIQDSENFASGKTTLSLMMERQDQQLKLNQVLVGEKMPFNLRQQDITAFMTLEEVEQRLSRYVPAPVLDGINHRSIRSDNFYLLAAYDDPQTRIAGSYRYNLQITFNPERMTGFHFRDYGADSADWPVLHLSKAEGQALAEAFANDFLALPTGTVWQYAGIKETIGGDLDSWKAQVQDTDYLICMDLTTGFIIYYYTE